MRILVKELIAVIEPPGPGDIERILNPEGIQNKGECVLEASLPRRRGCGAPRRRQTRQGQRDHGRKRERSGAAREPFKPPRPMTGSV